jgi:hypothetical protein
MSRGDEPTDASGGSGRGLVQRVVGAVSTVAGAIALAFAGWAAWTNGGWVGRSLVIGLPVIVIVAVLALVLSK